jgi:thiol-disulfide isomerase/thioredoxin
MKMHTLSILFIFQTAFCMAQSPRFLKKTTLITLSAEKTTLKQQIGNKPFVLIFFNTDCPICQKYTSILRGIADSVSDVKFILVFSKWDSLQAIKDFVNESGLGDAQSCVYPQNFESSKSHRLGQFCSGGFQSAVNGYTNSVEFRRNGAFKHVLYAPFLRNSMKNLKSLRRIKIRRYKIDRPDGSLNPQINLLGSGNFQTSPNLNHLWDYKNKLIKKLKATNTPEAFFFDKNGTLQYRGAIDNWFYELGRYRPQATEQYLKNALTQFLKNEKITVAHTKPVGCLIEY